VRCAIVFIFVIGMLLSQCMAEEQVETLTWEECVREAQENNPELIAARHRLAQALADKTVAQSAFLPHISASLRETTSKASMSDTVDSYSYGVSLRQLIFDGFKSTTLISQAEERVNIAEYNYQIKSADIRLGLRTAFINLLQAQELLTIREDIARRRKQQAELVRLRYEAGREHKGSLLIAEAKLAQAESEIVQAKRNIEAAQRALCGELGRTEFVPIRVVGNLDVKLSLPREPDFESIAENHPQLKAQLAEKRISEFGIRVAKANFYPEVSLSMSASKSAEYWPPDRDSWSVGVSVSLPLFEGRSRFAQLAKARAILWESEAQERNIREELIVSLQEAWTQFVNAIDTLRVQKTFLKAAEVRAQIAESQYSNGLISFDNWIIIEDDLASAKIQLVNAMANALIAEARWIYAKGGTLDYDQRQEQEGVDTASFCWDNPCGPDSAMAER